MKLKSVFRTIGIPAFCDLLQILFFLYFWCYIFEIESVYIIEGFNIYYFFRKGDTNG